MEIFLLKMQRTIKYKDVKVRLDMMESVIMILHIEFVLKLDYQIHHFGNSLARKTGVEPLANMGAFLAIAYAVHQKSHHGVYVNGRQLNGLLVKGAIEEFKLIVKQLTYVISNHHTSTIM